MNKTAQSQWDFGELFSAAATRKTLTVSELTTRLRRLLEKDFANIWITGEVTNFRLQPSGHIYFTLKDANAQLSCVLFRSEPVAHRELLEDGKKLALRGYLTVFEPRGQCQLVVQEVELHGAGALQLAFEKLKQKLQAEGLFAQARKRPIPKFPGRVGIVTSPSSAAIRDVLHVIGRRHAGLELILAGCRVQGMGAAEEIACAIRLLNDWSRDNPAGEQVDLILVTRGGGSLEDLWAFNEEIVARAIFHSQIPVISAVGHEIDFTISDFVADLRAATPSAAAELITEGYFASRRSLLDTAAYLQQMIIREVEQCRDQLGALTHRLGRVHPKRWLNDQLQRVDDLSASLARCLKQHYRHAWTRWGHLQQRLSRLRPSAVLPQKRQHIHDLQRRLREAGRNRRQEFAHRLKNVETRLKLLSPENVLARGYSITMDADSGNILRTASGVKAGQKLKTKLHKGSVISRVEKPGE